MTGKRHLRRGAEQPEPSNGQSVAASQGANAAGRDVINSVAVHADIALPAEAYAPIPAGAAQGGLSNIPGTRLFVGRDLELNALDAAFATPGGVVLQALSGLGGVGKTLLAARWADTRAAARVRWWIAADRPEAINDDLAKLARGLQPGLAQLPDEIQTERALQWLAGHEDWLLVLDNVLHPDYIRPLLDRVGTSGRILVTTRRATGWHHLATSLRLDVFTPAESAELFTRILAQGDSPSVEGIAEVCEELGHLALAVEQAAAFCHETAIAPRAYLEMLHDSPGRMYELVAEGGETERKVARIWRITFDRLADTPLAGRILRILAWYAPDRIPRTLLESIAEAPAVAAAVGRLRAYSMINANPDGTLSVHRLVQALARTPQDDDPHRQRADIAQALNEATTFLQAALPPSWEDPATWPAWRDLHPHLDALADHAPSATDSEATAMAFGSAGFFLNSQGQSRRAATYLERASNYCKGALGEDDPTTTAFRNGLAYVYQSAGNLGRAILLYEKNLDDNRRVLGEDHPNTLGARNNLASAYIAAGDLDRAVPLYELNHADTARLFGNEHPNTLTSRNNLASAYQAAGNSSQAISLHGRNHTDTARVLGEDHPTTLTSRNNLAGAYASAGDLDRAIPLYERALNDRVRVLGEDHPETLTSRNGLAGAYASAGDLDRAIPLYER
ncbi:FxSxx-COOH system tetratricopeptide repeat protein, partial [Streptomyces griseorubiginosus]|uniref:FxSxx-COOH system tetratricopeptide repeat protein n=1 Tax=Streptomyces griseorubiginosus TaxID=67304 RepID=UPI0033F15860